MGVINCGRLKLLETSQYHISVDLFLYFRDEYWCYADYNYMAKLFADDSAILDSVDWSSFGFNERNGYQSTIWIGSEQAFTPCHQDTYGLNLVAQIDGVKKWLLLPPSESHALNPLRVPYEESSIFTQVDDQRLEQMSTCLKVSFSVTFFCVFVMRETFAAQSNYTIGVLSVNIFGERKLIIFLSQKCL